MYLEMKEVLEFNFNHMFTNFKQIIVNELVDNFEGCIRQWNNGRFDDKIIDYSRLDLDKIKKILGQ